VTLTAVVLWGAFLTLIVGLLALDLGVFHRREREISTRDALAWTAFYVALALAFVPAVWWSYERTAAFGEPVPGAGRAAVVAYLTAYVLEKSLSLDNIFVISTIFGYFRVPSNRRHRVLFWGIVGAVVLRGAMIAAGAAAIRRFDWVVYVFGGFLLFAALRMLGGGPESVDPEHNPLVRAARRLYPVTPSFEGARFFVRANGRRAMTPLFLALLMVESSDVLFAVDSIPAAFAVTRDPFLVFTSNIFAVLGLRSLYFALAGLIRRFRYLELSMVAVLAYIGVKMLLSHVRPIPNAVSLAVVAVILAAGAVASMVRPGRPDGPDGGDDVVPREVSRFALWAAGHARRVVVALIGATVVLIGVAMLVLPGPGVVTMFVGLTILAAEFAWARRWLKRARELAGEAAERVSRYARTRNEEQK